MKLYIVSTDYFNYDMYDSHVVAADSATEAKEIADLPKGKKDFEVKYIGEYFLNKKGILHSSFNAR